LTSLRSSSRDFPDLFCFYCIQALRVDDGFEPDFRLDRKKLHCPEQDLEMAGSEMGLDSVIGFPLLLEDNEVFRLDIQVAVAAYAVLFASNQDKQILDGIHHFIPLITRHRHLDMDIEHQASSMAT
jgi:hypothetical protein